MSEFRLNFLNWRPDAEDTEHDGLTVADNVIHETEGYKPVHLQSAGGFITTGSLAASTATVTSIVVRQVGPQSDLFCAWLQNNTLHVGVNGVTSPSTTTGYPQSFAFPAASQEVVAFDVCEYAGRIFFVAQAQNTTGTTPATETLISMGYLDYG